MSDIHVSEAAVSTLRAQGVRAVRLLYTDLHGVARGKDIPLAHFADMVDEGVAFCSAVMGTDLRHTPVVGGEAGYVDFAIKPDLNTLRVAPTWRADDPTEVKVAWCLGEAWTLDGSDHWPVCPRALLERVVDRFAERGRTSSSRSSSAPGPSTSSWRFCPPAARTRTSFQSCAGATSWGCARSPRITSS